MPIPLRTVQPYNPGPVNIKQGIVEIANSYSEGKREIYLPHKPAIKELAESTKMRIVFDASAKPNQTSPSLIA